MKTIKKSVIVIILLTMVTSIFYPVSNATGLSDIISYGDSFVSAGQSSGSNIRTINGDDVKDVSDSVYRVLLVIGILVAVIVGAYIGIQFMIASAEDKAKVKESLIPYVAGCAVVFGAFGIWRLVVAVLGSSGL